MTTSKRQVWYCPSFEHLFAPASIRTLFLSYLIPTAVSQVDMGVAQGESCLTDGYSFRFWISREDCLIRKRGFHFRDR
jgi:hypothetical protein